MDYLIKKLRYLAMYLLNIVFRDLAVKIWKPEFLFAVYGDERDVRTYCSEAMQNKMRPIMIGNFIKLGKHRGFLVSSKYFESELAKDNDKVRDYIKNLHAEFPDVKKIALVGRLPTFVRRSGIRIDGKLVDGAAGTRFMIKEALSRFENRDRLVVLGGVGRIGGLVCQDALGMFGHIVAFDIRKSDDEFYGSCVHTSDVSYFKGCRNFVCLLPVGGDIETIKQFIEPGALIADDTHPPIHREIRKELQENGVEVNKIIAVNPKFKCYPKMPQWKSGAIPGCLVEALALIEDETLDPRQWERFSRAVKEQGFSGLLTKTEKV